jgi:NLI interacting factor-like phosphatase
MSLKPKRYQPTAHSTTLRDVRRLFITVCECYSCFFWVAQKFLSSFSPNSAGYRHEDVRAWVLRHRPGQSFSTGKDIYSYYKSMKRRNKRQRDRQLRAAPGAKAAAIDSEAAAGSSLETTLTNKRQRPDAPTIPPLGREQSYSLSLPVPMLLSSSSLSGVPTKRLLILDLNKVLLYRRPRSTSILPRPHVQEFLSHLSNHYTLASWTSVKNETAKIIRTRIFPEEIRSRLLFSWSQTQCYVDRSVESSTRPGKPLISKKLELVWRLFRQYSSANTILLDDTKEKCVYNPAHTQVCPLPFEPEDESIPSDEELKPGNRLCLYLDKLAVFEGDNEAFFELHGPYVPSSSSESGVVSDHSDDDEL